MGQLIEHVGRRESLGSIQGLRGIAAFSVVVHHALGGAQLKFGGAGDSPLHFGDVGASGVDVFFVISGFIMIYTSRAKFGERGAGMDFFVRRLIRIAPLYWLFSLVMVALLIFAPTMFSTLRFSVGHAVDSFLFIPTVNSNGEYVPVLAVGWTLVFEMYFYLVFAALLATSPRWSLLFAGVLFSVSVVAGLAAPTTGPIAFVLTNQLLIEFFLGECIGLLFILGWLPARSAAYGLLAAVAAVYGFQLFFGLPEGPRLLHRGVPAALLVLTFVSIERSGKEVFPTWMGAVGDSSYSLYLIHTMWIAAVYKAFSVLDASNRLPLGLLIALAVFSTLIAARLTFSLVERPVTSRLIALWAKRGARPGDAANLVAGREIPDRVR